MVTASGNEEVAIKMLGTYGEGRGEGGFLRAFPWAEEGFPSQEDRQVEILESILLWRRLRLLTLEGILSPQRSRSQLFCWESGG